MKKTNSPLNHYLNRKYLFLLAGLVAIIAVISLSSRTHPEKDLSLKACTSDLAPGVNQIQYNYHSAIAPQSKNYSYTIVLNCNGSKLDVKDPSDRHFESSGKNDAASQQIIATLASDLVTRKTAIPVGECSDPNAAGEQITLSGPAAEKKAQVIDLCEFKDDERAAALVGQIKALIPDLDATIAAHSK